MSSEICNKDEAYWKDKCSAPLQKIGKPKKGKTVAENVHTRSEEKGIPTGPPAPCLLIPHPTPPTGRSKYDLARKENTKTTRSGSQNAGSDTRQSQKAEQR
jgi:hypothetical protein